MHAAAAKFIIITSMSLFATSKVRFNMNTTKSMMVLSAVMLSVVELMILVQRHLSEL